MTAERPVRGWVTTGLVQADVQEWESRQPWAGDPPAIVALGLGEEAGEVQRAVLKMHQGIRGTREEWIEEARKECGDVFIKLCAVASSLGFDLGSAISERWDNVRQRNWTADKIGHGIEKPE